MVNKMPRWPVLLCAQVSEGVNCYPVEMQNLVDMWAGFLRGVGGMFCGRKLSIYLFDHDTLAARLVYFKKSVLKGLFLPLF